MPMLTVRQGDVSLTVPFEGTPLLGDVLASRGLGVQQPCGGRGICGKCAVRAAGRLSTPPQAVLENGMRLTCQTTLLGDCSVLLPPKQDGAVIQTESVRPAGDGARRDPMPGRFGAAVDIGTTTLALRLLDLEAGRLLARQAALNPQVQVSADVIGRIGAALASKGPWLEQAVLECLEDMLRAACAEAGVGRQAVASLVLTGNTTMLYLLTGRSPEPLSHAPFHADTLFGLLAPLMGGEAYLPPCMDAFVGADITCAVLACGMCDRAETALLMDVGTNGEVALWHDGRLYVASTAAGPAFEGVGISCGCGSVPGAVDSVRIENGRLAAHTIAGAEPVGLCGSGLIDAVAALLALDRIDETGAMDEECAVIAGPVHLTARDVRSVQLAKGAVAAGVATLLRHAGVAPAQVGTLYIAGGFGSHLNIESAAAIGLVPPELTGRVRVLGNAALAGAEMLLLDRSCIQQAEKIARSAQSVLLSGNPVFSELFMECMAFGSEE